jgi:hypothetical protein
MNSKNSPKTMKIPKSIIQTLLGGYALFALSATALAQTEDLSYSSGSQGEDGALSFPTPLNSYGYYGAVAGDTTRNEVVAFGGYDSSRRVSSATWVWSQEKGWEEKFPVNSPPARERGLMCYDSERKEIVLYGGWGQNGELYDTWVWNGQDWQQKSPTNQYSIYSWNSAMVYDAVRKKAVIIPSNYNGGGMYLWDGENWTQESISMPSSIGYYFSAVYDAKNEKIVLLTRNGETWLFSGTSWVKSESANKPSNANNYYSRQMLAYDPVEKKVLFFGGSGNGNGNNYYNYYGNDTWAWDGGNWEELTPNRSPSPRYGHVVAGIGDGVVLVGGWMDQSGDYNIENTALQGSTEFWDGENWNYSSGGIFDVDMSEKEDGVWRYSSIKIPKGMVVRFNKNESNSPVQWLASGHVEIDGIIDVSGENGDYYYFQNYNGQIYEYGSKGINLVKNGGPGGFDGGKGGIRFQESASYEGAPGVGPGGGFPGKSNDGTPQNSYGKSGSFTGSADSTGQIRSSYGNTYLTPLVGGSGGGGSASFDSVDGVSGGGGGGAILIASTRDIVVNGKILAKGGSSGSENYYYYYNNNYTNSQLYSGAGSGGAIRLVADRVIGKGSLSAAGGNGYSYWGGENYIYSNEASAGRIRIEAFERDLANSPSNLPAAFQAPPLDVSPIKNIGTLRVQSVAGKNVEETPSGDLEAPDVTFNAPGTVAIKVAGTGLDDETRVRVRVTMRGGAIESDPVNLSGGSAEFQVNVPAGVGTIQAYTLRNDSTN